MAARPHQLEAVEIPRVPGNLAGEEVLEVTFLVEEVEIVHQQAVTVDQLSSSSPLAWQNWEDY